MKGRFRAILLTGSWVLFCGLICGMVLTVPGCGGGGGEGGPAAPATSGNLTGKVTTTGTIQTAMRLREAVRALTISGNAGVPDAEVWVEDNPGTVVRTDADGRFVLPGVTFGVSHRLVSRYRHPGTGELYVIRTDPVELTLENPTREVSGVILQKGMNPIVGRLIDLDGKAIAGAELSIWGMKFFSRTDGTFTSPELPETVSEADVLIAAAGYRTTSFRLPFYAADLPPYFEIILAAQGEVNTPPITYLSSTTAAIQPQTEVRLQAYVADPDEVDPYSSFKPVWTTTGGSITPTTDPFVVVWNTPPTAGLATVAVSVTDSRGGSGRAEQAFAVGGQKSEIMQISAFSPKFGGPGTVVTISGTGFGTQQDDSRVSFNGLDGTIQAWTDTDLRVTVPAQVTTGLVVIYSGARERTAGTFTVSDPTLTLSPVFGPAGTLVTITGSDFGPTRDTSTLTLNGATLDVQSWSDTTCTAKIPSGAQTGALILTVRGRERTVGVFSVSRVISTSPVHGVLGTRWIAYGEGFGDVQSAGIVKFSNGVQAASVTWSDTRISAAVPAGAVSGPVTTKIQGADFTLGTINLCMLNALSPDRSLPNAEVTLTGSGFGATMGTGTVRFNTSTATINLWTDTKIVAVVPASATPGMVVVTNAFGNSSIGKYYQVTWVEAIDLQRVHAGSVLKFTGYGFGSDIGGVLFGSVEAQEFMTWTDRTVEAVVPDGPAGLTTVKVLAGGVISNEKTVTVAVTGDADISEGWVGREITIAGQYFGATADGNYVTLSGIQAPLVSWADTAIKVRVPVGAASGPLNLIFASATVELGDFDVTPVETLSFVTKWSGAQTKSTPIVHGVVVNSAGETFVADYDNDWIWKYDAAGTFVAKFGSNGAGDAQLKGPRGMAVDSADLIYIADTGNNRIQVMNSSGAFQGWYGMDSLSASGWHVAGGGSSPGAAGSADGQFDEPSDVAVDSGGNMYIMDTGNSRFQKLAAAGGFALKVGAAGTGDSQFTSPRGIHVDAGGAIYVADTGNHRIQIFNAAGALQKWIGLDNTDVSGAHNPASGKVGKLGSGNGQMYQPYDVALDAAGQMVVSDTGNSRLQVIKTDGTFVQTVSTKGDVAGQLDFPSTLFVKSGVFYVADAGNYWVQKLNAAQENLGTIVPNTAGLGTLHNRIAIDSARGVVYVVDEQDHSVSKFTPVGSYTGKLGSQGYGNGQFNTPRGIALDAAGNVYVLDAGNARVQKFDSNGLFISKFGSFGTADGQMRDPEQLGVTPDGNTIFVADTDNSRVQKFSGTGTFQAKWGSAGTGDSQFQTISGLAVDPASATVYVADRYGHRVQKFDYNGTLLGWFGNDNLDVTGWHNPGSGRTGKNGNTQNGQFDEPIDVAVDEEGGVYVTTFQNQDMQKFGQDQTAGAGGNYRATLFATDGFGGVGVDAFGNVYLTNDNNEIEKFTPDIP